VCGGVGLSNDVPSYALSAVRLTRAPNTRSVHSTLANGRKTRYGHSTHGALPTKPTRWVLVRRGQGSDCPTRVPFRPATRDSYSIRTGKGVGGRGPLLTHCMRCNLPPECNARKRAGLLQTSPPPLVTVEAVTGNVLSRRTPEPHSFRR